MKTRKKKPATRTRPAKEKPVAGRVAQKPRHAARGKVVASCPEFTLYADGWIESSPAVDAAMLRSSLGINKRGGDTARLALSLALWDLMEDRAGQFTGDREDLMERLSETLGELLLRAFDDGNRTRPISALAAARRAVEGLAAATRQMERFRTRRPMPGEKSPGAWTWIAQHEAKTMFRETRERPSQAAIRAALEAEGWAFRGHDPAENWRRVFLAAGLGNLPS